MSKKLICLTSFILVLGLTTTFAKADISDGLVAYWPLDEGTGTTTADLTGNGSDGTFVDAPAWVGGKLGNALDFDGSNDAVDCGNSPLLDFGTGDFAISLWIKVDSTQGDATLFGKGGDHSSTALPGVRYQIMFRDDDNGDIRPILDDDTTKLGSDTETYDGLIDDQWHHIVFMRLSGTVDDFVRVYIDGNEDTAFSGKGDSTFPANFDLSGTSLFNAYIGATRDARNPAPDVIYDFL